MSDNTLALIILAVFGGTCFAGGMFYQKSNQVVEKPRYIYIQEKATPIKEDVVESKVEAKTVSYLPLPVKPLPLRGKHTPVASQLLVDAIPASALRR